MRKSLLAVAALPTSVLFAQDYWCLNRSVSITTEYTYLRRQELRELSLVKEVPEFFFLNNQISGITVLDTKDLEKRLGWESGVRGGLTIHGSECASFEFLYTYVWPWKAVVNVEAHEGAVLRFPFKDPSQTTGFNRAKKAEGIYTSWLQNAEATYWGHVTPQRCNYFSFSWDIGFRFVWLKEEFELNFFQPMSIGNYFNETHNVLYGLQLGAMLEMNPDACWTWTFMIKGAGFLNVAQNKLTIYDDNQEFLFRHYTKNKWTDSWLLEGYGQLAYHFGAHVSIHFGYQGYILTGLALAPEQRDICRHSRRKIRDRGQIVIDGLYTGFDLNF